MARADLLKKLFKNFVAEDKDGFLKIANEIIEDERKKNHAILADELKIILNNRSAISPRGLSSMSEITKEASLFEVIYPDKMLSDIVLTADNKNQIEQIIKEFYNWDVLIHNGVHPIHRVLLYGPPGCGKTVTANAIAAEIGLPLLYVRFDAIISSFLGETASNIRKVFDYVKGNSFVILFDEFDAIARSRNDQFEHGEIKRVVNTFLQQLDSFKGRSLIIAATNFEQSLDFAVWRRFDSTLKFEMPDNNERLQLFNLKLRHFRGSEKIINEFLPQMNNFSHADVERAAISVMKQCILEGRKMYTKKDVEQAIVQQEKLVSLRKTHY